MLKAWFRDEAGQAMSEYGLLIAILVVGVVLVAGALRNQIGAVFKKATSDLNAQVNAPVQP